MHELGAIELEILRSALTAGGGGNGRHHLAHQPIDRGARAAGLLDRNFRCGRFNVAQSARIPQHLNSMGAGLRTVLLEFIPTADWEEGDVVITNDPYCGGQHIPDFLAFRAVFAAGRRVAIVGTLCHHLDMGGISAGSYGATATEIFQEGLRIPPMKLIRRGVLNQEVLAMMRQNVRRPGHAVGRSASAIGLAERGRGQHAAPGGTLRNGNACGRLRATAGWLGAGDARHDRAHPGTANTSSRISSMMTG